MRQRAKEEKRENRKRRKIITGTKSEVGGRVRLEEEKVDGQKEIPQKKR